MSEDRLTDEIRNEFAFDEMVSPGSQSDIEKRAIFDTWLAEHDRQVAERAWDECARTAHLEEGEAYCKPNPYREEAHAVGSFVPVVSDVQDTAHTPTDDERGWGTQDRREALDEAKRRFMEWDGSDDEGVQRFGAGSVNGFVLGAEWQKARTVQGEPTDAQVEAALQALGHSRSGVTAPVMRAALRAAGGAR